MNQSDTQPDVTFNAAQAGYVERIWRELERETRHEREMKMAYRGVADRWQMAFWLVAPGAIASVVLLVVCHVGQ